MAKDEKPPATEDEARQFADDFERATAAISVAVVGKKAEIRKVLAALFAGGHVLLEDVPGVGKTLLAKALAEALGGTQSRIQFTPDLLPSDITGVSIWNQSTREFEFKHGPVFASIVLADEINRASPKTQSALLQVMEERAVTVDGKPESVGKTFMVIATQNPIEQAGTYRLPEAQLDRFLVKTKLGYPAPKDEMKLMRDGAKLDREKGVKVALDTAAVLAMTELASRVVIQDSVVSYAYDLIDATRKNKRLEAGVSVRGSLQLIRIAKVWAMASRRNFVIAEDIRDLAVAVLAHRLILKPDAEFDQVKTESIITEALDQIAVPEYR